MTHRHPPRARDSERESEAVAVGSDLGPVLLAALEQTRSPACVTTADLDAPGPTIVYVNPAYCAMTGRSRNEVLGRSPRLMQGPLTDRAVLDRLRAELEAGGTFTGETVNYRADGTPFIINWSIDPVCDDAGEITHFIATQEDVTERVRAARLRAAEKSLDETLQEVVSSAASSEAARQAVVEEIRSGAAKIAAAGRCAALLIDDAVRARTQAGAPPSDAAERFEFAHPQSAVRGEVSVDGLDRDAALLLDRDGLRRFTSRAGAVVAALAEYQRQRHTAVRLQQSLLPSADPGVAGFEVVTRYEPGSFGLDVGGDWYDAVETADRVVFAVGDVCGSGVDAAALMGRLRLAMRLEVERGTPVPAVLELLDRLCRDGAEMATLLAAEIVGHRGPVRLFSAGHLPPVVLDGTRAALGPLDVAPPLGHLNGAVPVATEVELDRGQGLLLFTDGLVERRGESLGDGLDRLLRAVPAAGDLAGIVDTVMIDARRAGFADDVALLAFGRR